VTYKLEIGLQAAHDQPRRDGRHQLAPLLAVGRVDVNGEVGDPVHPRRLGEAVVVDVVNVCLGGVVRVSRFMSSYFRAPTPHRTP
jgi:hypothetical protein